MISFSKLGQYGRAGNQLFQIAATISLALQNNDKYVFPPWSLEKYFNLHNCFSEDIKFKYQYHEQHFHYIPIQYQSDLDLIGFFQSEKYFKDNKDIILSKLSPKEGFGIIQNTTAVHVRRGDYVGNAAYEQLGMNYYLSAMNMINSKYYYVFSDDIDWCKKNFTGNNITFIENNSTITDLSLMSSCTHQIISNSSFSFWGAYLNKWPNKTVIAPKKWFGPALKQHNTIDLLPDSWLKIDVL